MHPGCYFHAKKSGGLGPLTRACAQTPAAQATALRAAADKKGETWGVMKSNTWGKNLFQRQGFVGDYYRLVNFKLQFDAVLATQSA